MKKKYWFYIDVYCYTRIVKDSLLIYNSLTGKIIEYHQVPEIIRIIRKLQMTKNLGVISLTENDLKNPTISRFVADVRREFLGDLVDAELSDGKPIQMVPQSKIFERVEYGNNKKSIHFTGEKVIEYLRRLTLYLTDSCPHHCHICKEASKQFLWCRKGDGRNKELNHNQIVNLLQKMEEKKWINIDIIGGDPFSYSSWHELTAALSTIPVKKTLYIHWLQAIDRLPLITNLINDNLSLGVLIHFPAEIEKLKNIVIALKTIDPQVVFHFIIESARDFEQAESISHSSSLNKVEYHPFFNGQNLDFFKENVYINKSDISADRPLLKRIFANQMVNSFHFGKLIVFPSGKVKAAMHSPILGNISKNSLGEIIYMELNKDRNWTKVRQHLLPCKECLYTDLCPPISNYNRIIGKNNLCHIFGN